MKNIVIVGAGYSGLSTAHYLKNINGYKITLLESSDKIGGLAFAFKEKEWNWNMEKYIHHWFSNDQYIIDLAKELGVSHKLILKPTKSSIFYNGKIAQMDSPLSLLKLPFIPVMDRIRTGLIMAKIKLDKNILSKEKETAFHFIKRTMGQRVFRILWEPLFWGKFGKHAPSINAAWFCGRIQARTKKLMYFEGGFGDFTKSIEKSILSKGHNILLNSPVKKIIKNGEKYEVYYRNKKILADFLVLALPLPVAFKIFEFKDEFKKKYSSLNSIGSQYFVLELNKPFLKDKTYWLNINEKGYPFMMLAKKQIFFIVAYINFYTTIQDRSQFLSLHSE
jgi:protoporphyrinogen oxidase